MCCFYYYMLLLNISGVPVHTLYIWVTVLYPVLLYPICPCQQLTCFSSSQFSLLCCVKAVWFCLRHPTVPPPRVKKSITINLSKPSISTHGAARTFLVKLSNSIRLDYPTFLHMSMWRSVCCLLLRKAHAKPPISLSLLLYVRPGGGMLSRSGDAFS